MTLNGDRNTLRNRRAEDSFVTKSAGDGLRTSHPVQESIADAPSVQHPMYQEPVEQNYPTTEERFQFSGGFQTPGAALLSASSSTFPEIPLSDSPAPKVVTRSSIDAQQLTYFCVGAVVGMALATLAAYHYNRRRRSLVLRRRGNSRRDSFDSKPWAHEIQFRDECDSTSDEDDSDYLEEGDYRNSNPPIDSYSENSRSRDWLGGVGFDEESTNHSESINNDNGPFLLDDESNTDNGEVVDEMDDLLNNGDSSKSNHSSVPSLSPLSSPLADGPSPPTVKELFFENAISSRWTSDTDASNESDQIYYQLQKEQEELNKDLFVLNDKLLEQQRELEVAAKNMTQKTTRRKHRDHYNHHKSITEEIAELEKDKESVAQKLTVIRLKIKHHRLERRRKLFL